MSQPAERRKRRDMTLSFEKTSQQRHRKLTLVFQWPELSHMTITQLREKPKKCHISIR